MVLHNYSKPHQLVGQPSSYQVNLTEKRTKEAAGVAILSVQPEIPPADA